MILSNQRQTQILNETTIVLGAIDRHRREAIRAGQCKKASELGGLWAGVSMTAQRLTAQSAHSEAA